MVVVSTLYTHMTSASFGRQVKVGGEKREEEGDCKLGHGRLLTEGDRGDGQKDRFLSLRSRIPSVRAPQGMSSLSIPELFLLTDAYILMFKGGGMKRIPGYATKRK